MAKYRVGVIGCGGIGIQHATGLVGLDNVCLVAGCDLNQETQNAFQAHWAGTWDKLAFYEDYRQMLDEQALDIVTIATPDNCHADPVVDAAQAGVKAIFCEKPLATSLVDVERMRSAIVDNKIVFSLDHTRRWLPLWHRLKEVVDGGEIGALQYIVGTLSGARGSLFRNGTHLIDALCYVAGAQPEWVFAELERGYEDHSEYRGDGGADPALEPSASGYIHFTNGVRAFYTGTSKKTAGPKWHFEIVGSAAKIFIDKEAILVRDGQQEKIIPAAATHSGIPAGVRELVEALDQGQPTSSPLDAALDVSQVIFGFLASQQRGNVRVDLPLSSGA